MEMLLRSRRRTSMEVSEVTVEDSPSVEDILRSCSEYDVNSEPYFRHRASSDVMQQSPLSVLLQEISAIEPDVTSRLTPPGDAFFREEPDSSSLRIIHRPQFSLPPEKDLQSQPDSDPSISFSSNRPQLKPKPAPKPFRHSGTGYPRISGDYAAISERHEGEREGQGGRGDAGVVVHTYQSNLETHYISNVSRPGLDSETSGPRELQQQHSSASPTGTRSIPGGDSTQRPSASHIPESQPKQSVFEPTRPPMLSKKYSMSPMSSTSQNSSFSPEGDSAFESPSFAFNSLDSSASVLSFTRADSDLTTSDPQSPKPQSPKLGDTQSPGLTGSDTQSSGVQSPDSAVFTSGPMSSLTVDTSLEAATHGRISPAPRSPNAKLEAVEALKWLKAAGFPQYAQMFQDGQFPVELFGVEKDHDFLDKDSLQSLFRRLDTLNKYAGMKIDAHPRKKPVSEDEDEEDLCALSERWEYQKSNRRWSRKDLLTPTSSPTSGDLPRAASHDSLLADQDSDQTGDSPLLQHRATPTPTDHAPQANIPEKHLQQESGDTMTELQHHHLQQNHLQQHESMSPRLRRVASERIKTAKSLFRKMEGGLKPKKSRRTSRKEIGEISGPVLENKGDIQAKLQRLQCVDISPTGETNPLLVQGSVAQKPSLTSDLPAGLAHKQTSQNSPPPMVTNQPAPPPSRFADPSKYIHAENTASKSLINSSRAQAQSPVGVHPPAGSVPAAQTVDQTSSQLDSMSTSSSTSTLTHDATLRSRLTPAASHHGAVIQNEKVSPLSPPPSDSLGDYLSAQNQLHQTLAGSKPPLVRKSSDTQLMEIFLLPQDHQPGRFPRLLQNGYIETEGAGGLGVNARTGSVRLGRDTGTPISGYKRQVNSRPGLPPQSSFNVNRVSVYDNFTPGHGGSSSSTRVPVTSVDADFEHAQSISGHVISGNILEQSPEPHRNVLKHTVSFDSSPGLSHRVNNSAPLPDSPAPVTDSPALLPGTDTSSSSSSSPSPSSREASISSFRDRSVSFESSSSRTFEDPAGERRVGERPGDVRGVTHSRSDNSYFRDDVSAAGSTSSASKGCEEFDLILQQLYNNIDDLTRSMRSGVRDVQPASTPGSRQAASPHVDVVDPAVVDAPLYINAHHEPLSAKSSLLSQQSSAALLQGPASPQSPTTSDLLTSGPASPDVSRDVSLDALDGLTDAETSSSQASDVDVPTDVSHDDVTDVSHDDSLDQIPTVTRERRDSGMGLSLKRAPSEGKRKKLRWHSFQRCHRPDVSSRAMQINSLTVGHLVRLQKLSLLRLTSIMEKCLPVNKSGWNWQMPRFMKRHKAPDFSDKHVFGIPLSVMVQRTGQPLPQCVLYAMRYLRRTSQKSVGIFRKSGVKSKIQQLRDHLEENPDITDFEGVNAYNVADMLKTFFRDLPECLLTNKLSETFRSIYTHVPLDKRLEAIQAAILLLPDENREVLQSILLFLYDISTFEADHQMNASNLAVCFTPTVFMLGARTTGTNSPKRNRKNPGVPDPREIMEQKAAHECLTMMILESKKLFTVPFNLFRQLQVQSVANIEPTPLQNICGDDPTSEVRAFGQERIQMVLKEAHDSRRGWIHAYTLSDIEVCHRKPLDDCPLREWKLVVDIEAPPIEVLRRIMHERHAWDEDLLSWSVVERLDPHSDIFQFVLNSMAPHPSRHFCVLRYWRSDLTKGACALITMSVEHTDAVEVQGVRACDLGSYFLMEPCGSGRSRLTYITRVDTRGRTPEWYNKIYGYTCANFVDRLRESFKQETMNGPETKV